MKVAIAGIGYVGLSNSILLALNNYVIAYDIDKEKVDLINNKKSPLNDKYINEYLAKKNLNLTATTDFRQSITNSEILVVCVPTDYKAELGMFDTSVVEKVIGEAILINPNLYIIIKSTVPIGFTEKVKEKFCYEKIVFSPEFLREGNALYDNLYPNRIVIGDNSKIAHDYIESILKSTLNEPKVFFVKSTEAEAIKLFSNTYLAMRVSFFNELDTFCELNKLCAINIINGVCADSRIGQGYNNPSFGYGGYCLPKDSKQLLSNYSSISNALIKAVVESNQLRKIHIAKQILKMKPQSIGIYRLTMKTNSDNFRESAIFDIIETFKKKNIPIIVYEPMIKLQNDFYGMEIINDLCEFKKKSDVIIANRISEDINDVVEKVYSRDLFGNN